MHQEQAGQARCAAPVGKLSEQTAALRLGLALSSAYNRAIDEAGAESALGAAIFELSGPQAVD